MPVAPCLRVARTCTLLLVAVAAAGCGESETPPAPPRPVLVIQPQADADPGAMAYAGEIRARQESPLSFRVGGKLIRRDVDAGDRVARGQVLAALDPGDQRLQAQAAQAQLAAADAELVRARADRDRFATLATDQLVSRSALDQQDSAFRAADGQARAARANLDVARNQADYTALRAPSAGVIASREAEAGQVVAAGQTVFNLAADGGRDAVIAVPESRIRDVRVDQQVLVELWTAPGQRLPGRIREVAAAADPQTRSFAVRVALDDAAAAAVDVGQSARVYLAERSAAGGLTVPLAAIQRSDDGAASVWTVDPQGRTLVATPVRIGTLGADRVPVLSGLRRDAWVVAAGGHLLRAGQRVAPVDRDNRPVLEPARPSPATAAAAPAR